MVMRMLLTSSLTTSQILVPKFQKQNMKSSELTPLPLQSLSQHPVVITVGIIGTVAITTIMKLVDFNVFCFFLLLPTSHVRHYFWFYSVQ